MIYVAQHIEKSAKFENCSVGQAKDFFYSEGTLNSDYVSYKAEEKHRQDVTSLGS